MVYSLFVCVLPYILLKLLIFLRKPPNQTTKPIATVSQESTLIIRIYKGSIIMKFTKTLLASSLLLASGLATAETDWIVRAGFSVIAPDSNNHPVVSVEDATSFSFTLGKMMTKNIELEVLAAWPFDHDITLADGGATVGSAKHLPPTVSLNYHFMPEATFDPYIGLGINYTFFWDESTRGALDGTRLSLSNSFGFALQAGADFNLSNNWLINASVRYIDISTRATLDGVSLGNVNIDPIVYSLNFGKRF